MSILRVALLFCAEPTKETLAPPPMEHKIPPTPNSAGTTRLQSQAYPLTTKPALLPTSSQHSP